MLPEQPPPNAPAPWPSEAELKSRRSYRRIWLMGLVPLLLFLAAGLTVPFLFRARKSPQTYAVNNARAIHQALYEFQVEFGSYPSPATIPLVIKETGTTLSLGTSSSNDYFRQLIATGVDERIFESGSEKFRYASNALKKGESGFAYIVGMSEADGLNAPLVIAPVIPGKKLFDPEPFDKKIVMLRIDGSATSLTLRADGKIDLGGGKVIDPANPMWNGKTITIAWPE